MDRQALIKACIKDLQNTIAFCGSLLEHIKQFEEDNKVNFTWEEKDSLLIEANLTWKRG